MTMLEKIQGALDMTRSAQNYIDAMGGKAVFTEDELKTIHSVLEAAQQEAEARSTLRAWCAAGSGRYIQEAPHVPYIACIERGIERYESEVETEGEDVLTKAAAWCRAELAK